MKHVFFKPLQVGATWGGRPCEALPFAVVEVAQ